MGATRMGITGIFVRQGMIIGLIGTILGNVLAWALCYTQEVFHVISLPSDIYFMSSVPILLRGQDFLLVSSVTLALCFLSSLLPARLAARLRPVNAIRFS
jgi:lipoprotein-releasing system permease protein